MPKLKKDSISPTSTTSVTNLNNENENENENKNITPPCSVVKSIEYPFTSPNPIIENNNNITPCVNHHNRDSIISTLSETPSFLYNTPINNRSIISSDDDSIESCNNNNSDISCSTTSRLNNRIIIHNNNNNNNSFSCDNLVSPTSTPYNRNSTSMTLFGSPQFSPLIQTPLPNLFSPVSNNSSNSLNNRNCIYSLQTPDFCRSTPCSERRSYTPLPMLQDFNDESV